MTAIGQDVAKQLMAAAQSALDRAYAPYSGFPVGAAVLGKGGQIFMGTNIENASSPLSLCAERVAVGNAVTAGERELVAIAVASRSRPAATPCGGCRQVLAEFNPQITVLVAGQDPSLACYRLDVLLPHPFGSAMMADHEL